MFVNDALCEQCGATIVRTAKHPSKRFCDRGCASLHREAHRVLAPKPMKECECGCGELMPARGRLGERRYLYRHNPKTATARSGSCEFCTAPFTRPRRAGGTMQFCSRACSSASRRTDNPSHTGTRYRRWRAAVLTRDGFRCQRCPATDRLHAHHVLTWAEHPEARYDVDNGLTLCVDCHGVEHGRRLAA